MDTTKPIIFYDIASGPPVATYAPNPWKTRYALNYKGVAYRTEWVELIDVSTVRQRLALPANRKHMDGSDFFTLPIIHDTATGEFIGDSFEIAVYLDKTYPDGPTLLPPGTVGLHAAFNDQVNTVFTSGALLFSHGLPLNPETAEETKAMFEARMGGKLKWADFGAVGEQRKAVLETYKTALGGLAAYYKHDGPFLEGEKISYADLIVGAWLRFLHATTPEFKDICTWHDGRWGRLHAALEKYAEIK